MEAQDRLWFAEYRGDKIGMLDTKTGEFKQWDVTPKWSSPYDVALDKNAEAWTGSMLTDQVTRINTKTGEAVSYLLPRSTNIRRVHVEDRKSTRLNSSHLVISYAVFCLKKKKNI